MWNDQFTIYCSVFTRLVTEKFAFYYIWQYGKRKQLREIDYEEECTLNRNLQ